MASPAVMCQHERCTRVATERVGDRMFCWRHALATRYGVKRDEEAAPAKATPKVARRRAARPRRSKKGGGV